MNHKTFSALLWTCLLLMATPILSAKEKTEYYAGISGVISPFLEYHPVLPVTEAEAQTISHYRVKKDSKNRFLEIAWFQDGKPANNSYFVSHKVVYSYLNAHQYSRRYYNANGEPANMWRHYYQGGDIHEERYQRVENRRILTIHNAAGENIESTIGAHRFVAHDVDKQRYVQTQTNLKGDDIPYRTVMPFMAAMVSVDGDGFVDKVLNVNPDSLEPIFDKEVGYAAIKVNFNEVGIELGWEYQDENGSLVNLPMSDPDEPGVALTVWYREWRNQRFNQWSQIWVRYYDRTGAVVADKRGVYLLHYRRDEQNRMVEIGNYDKYNKLLFVEAEGFARKEFSYEGTEGTRVEKIFDANNHLIAD